MFALFYNKLFDILFVISWGFVFSMTVCTIYPAIISMCAPPNTLSDCPAIVRRREATDQ